MRRKFRFHDVAALSAELLRLHMLHRAIRALCADDDVDCGSYGEEDRQPSKIRLPVGYDSQPLLNLSPGQIKPKGDQHQADDEYDWNENKNDNPDVGIVGVPSKLEGRAKSQEKPAVVSSATPSILIQLLVRSASNGCFESSLMAYRQVPRRSPTSGFVLQRPQNNRQRRKANHPDLEVFITAIGYSGGNSKSLERGLGALLMCQGTTFSRATQDTGHWGFEAPAKLLYAFGEDNDGSG